jgi:hypothetical protein
MNRPAGMVPQENTGFKCLMVNHLCHCQFSCGFLRHTFSYLLIYKLSLYWRDSVRIGYPGQ